MARAKKLSEIIAALINKKGTKVTVDLLDGHGRMLVCLIKAVMDIGIDPDKVLNIRDYEIDENSHKYHQYVFPQSVKSISKLF